MRKCFFVSFRFFAFFSQSKTGYAEQKICLSSPAGQKSSPGDDTVRRHGFANLPSESKLFFHPHIPQKCFLRYAKNKNKNTINNFHKNEKTDSHLFNRSAFCSNGSIVFTQNLPGLSRLGCGKRHRRITAAKHLTPTTTNIDGEASRCTKTKKDLFSQVLFFVCTRIG